MPQFDIRYNLPRKLSTYQENVLASSINEAVDTMKNEMQLDSSGIDIEFYKR